MAPMLLSLPPGQGNQATAQDPAELLRGLLGGVVAADDPVALARGLHALHRRRQDLRRHTGPRRALARRWQLQGHEQEGEGIRVGLTIGGPAAEQSGVAREDATVNRLVAQAV